MTARIPAHLYRARGSALEAEVACLLAAAGLEFQREVQLIPDRKFRWDFVIPSKRAVVEVQGLKWHGKGAHNTPPGVARDAEKNNLAVLAGWRVFFITNQKGATSPSAVVAQIQRAQI